MRTGNAVGQGKPFQARSGQVCCDCPSLERCDAWVCLQPGCVYHVQLKAEGNDHIERALPHHRVVEVRYPILLLLVRLMPFPIAAPPVLL